MPSSRKLTPLAGWIGELRHLWLGLGGDEIGRAGIVTALAAALGLDVEHDAALRADLPATPGNLAAAELSPADLIGLAVEALVADDRRRTAGVHHTPRQVAEGLAGLALRRLGLAGERVPSVCDPAVGGGAFLLAVARSSVASGASPEAVAASLYGSDIDPVAADATRFALRLWAREQGLDDAALAGRIAANIIGADGLTVGASSWASAPAAGFDLVIGNPPFLGQLSGRTARQSEQRRLIGERFGLAAAGYIDTAGLFLLAGLELAAPGAVVTMLLPESVAAARDAGVVWSAIERAGRLSDIWVAGRHVFVASVRVCAPVVVIGEHSAEPADAWRGPGFEQVHVDAGPAGPWLDGRVGPSDLLASAYGTPLVRLSDRAGTVADLATATAGFRDQFYGLAPHIREAAEHHRADGRARLVTSGAIDPLCCRWGERPVRFAGLRWLRPVLDPADVAAGDAALGRWLDARLRPKLLVACQTKVIEVVVDPLGDLVPSVPVISVSPLNTAGSDGSTSSDGSTGDMLWRLAAVLSAPAVSAWALQRAAGSALSGDAIKLSASLVVQVPLPSHEGPWHEAAAGLACGGLSASEFAGLMGKAYGLAEGDPVSAWWLARLPSWPVSSGE